MNQGLPSKRRPFVTALCFVVACGHSDTFVPVVPTVGPSGTAADVQLTFNVEQDYWPAWTQDGAGILYSFVPADSSAYHRCIGLLPAAGGMRIWELCDNRAIHNDSATSYSAYALSSDDRLLYAEVVAPLFPGIAPPRPGLTPTRSTLWLADTAAPFQRTALLSLPVILGGTPISWLSELSWTGANTFIALGQDLAIFVAPQPPCNFQQDTNWANSGAVVVGTISGNQATLQPVADTAGASGYSLAQNGASVVFIRRDDQRLFSVPVGGGTAAVVATVTPATGTQLLGVSCKGSTCIVAVGGVTALGACPGVNNGPKELRSVSLVTGAAQVVSSASDVMVTPQISPVSGDVVAVVGGNLGHLMTILRPSNGNLHLFKALVP